MKNIFLKRRDLILSKIRTINNIECETPNGAFYIFPDFSQYLGSRDLHNNIMHSASDLCMYILNSTGVVTVSGDSFGAPGHIRLSYATSDHTISQAVELIKGALSKLTF